MKSGVRTWWVAAGLVGLGLVAGCGLWVDKLACDDGDCEFTADEWARIRKLAFVCSAEQKAAQEADPTVPCGDPVRPDFSNAYLPIDDWGTPEAVGTGALKANAAADPFVQFGRKLYFEPLLSGTAIWKDSLGRSSPSARAPKDERINVHCGSCHDPLRFGSDFTSVPRTVSIGAGWYDVNGQSTLNAARMPWLYWNGRSDALWAQAAQVIESPVSMNGHRMRTFWVIVNHHLDEYASLFPEAPAADPMTDAVPPTVNELAAELSSSTDPVLRPPAESDPSTKFKAEYDALKSNGQRRTVTWVHVNVAKAIAAYEWLLTSDDSNFDRFVNDGPRSSWLTPAARRGLKLFVGKASCVDCHSTPRFSDGKFHDIGIPQVGAGVPTVAECSVLPVPASGPKCDCVSENTSSCLPWGAYTGRLKLAAEPDFWRGSSYSDNPDAGQAEDSDAGSIHETPSAGALPAEAQPAEALKGRWRTPSLRDVAMTGPYMHDGIFATLSDVVWHYDQASSNGATAGADGGTELSALGLSPGERDDLVEFLASLTGNRRLPALLVPPDNIPDAGVSPSGPDAEPGDAAADAGSPEEDRP